MMRSYLETLFAGWAGITLVQIMLIQAGQPFMPVFYFTVMGAVFISSGVIQWLR